MSTANAMNGSPVEPRAADDPSLLAPANCLTPGLHQDQGLLLAQIPDLGSKASPPPPEKWLDGRIISQALSMKLVFGVGIGLLIGAILPFLFGKVSRPESTITELPAWTSSGSSTGNTSQTTAPTWPTSATPSAISVPGQTQPVLTPAIVAPQVPQVGDTRPTALTEPAWPQPRSSGAPAPAITPSPAPNNYINPPVASTNPLDNRGNYRGLDRGAGSAELTGRQPQRSSRSVSK